MSEHDSELQVVSRSRDGRRRYDEKGKRALVEAALRPGISVARLAQEHGVNANLLRKWITKYLLERESDRCPKDGAVVVDAFNPKLANAKRHKIVVTVARRVPFV